MAGTDASEPYDRAPSRRAGHELAPVVRGLLAVAGAAALTGGCAAIFAISGSGGAGGAALLAIGVASLWIGAMGVLPGTLKVAGVELTLPEKAERLAEEAVRQGRPDVARALRVSAQLADTAEPFSQAYDSIRRIAASSDDRTAALDALVRIVVQQTRDRRWSMEEARTLFASGHPGARIFALAMMRGNPRGEEADLAFDAIVEPRSRFEQWHALMAMRQMVPQLDDDWLGNVAASLSSLDLDGGATGRAGLRAEILEEIAGHRNGGSP
jgi:hypothetical protein